MAKKGKMPEPRETDCDFIITFPMFVNSSVLVWHDKDDLLKFSNEELSDPSFMQDFLTRDDFGAAAIRETTKDGANVFLLFFPGGKPMIRTVVHEAVHVVDDILFAFDIPLSFDNVEIRCYLTDYIVHELEKFYGW